MIWGPTQNLPTDAYAPVSYTGPQVNPALYTGTAPGTTYTGPGVDPSLYSGAANAGGAQSNLWDRLMGVIGQGGGLPKMPTGPTALPAGASTLGQQPAPPPMLGRPMPAPAGVPGLGAQATAGGGGNNQWLAQYMALQQLMRGS